MKRINYLFVAIATLLFLAACEKVTYKKTKSGLTYKIFPTKGKDSLIKEGDVVKLHYTFSFNDSLMDHLNSYGKMPLFVPIQKLEGNTYDFREILTMLKKGDSAVTVQMVDSLRKFQSPLLPPNAKSGDRIVMTMKILEVFTVDSIARADYAKEMERDAPRQEKERQEQEAQFQKEQEEAHRKKLEDWEKSGEIAKELKEMEEYLAAKNIKAQKTGNGTYVYIKEQGTGAPAANNKYVNVKYTGKVLRTDSVFQSNSYAFQLGKRSVIQGWDEGLLLFKEGGKGTLYIPGFLAYGESGGVTNKPFEALIFDVELLQVSDSLIVNQAPQRGR